MLSALKVILDIQELDIKMIRLMRLKREREEELKNLKSIKEDLQHQVTFKESEIIELKKNVRILEGEIAEIDAKVKKLEGQQTSIKKIEEFNALTQEISGAEREKSMKEQKLSDLFDQVAQEEDKLAALKETAENTDQSSVALESEILESIEKINQEGLVLFQEKDLLVGKADEEVLRIYDRLLKNKKDRVVVPIENRACSGCHIVVTAQHENLVRKGERLVFCEHCSRIHYWQDHQGGEEGELTPTRRRRRSSASA